MMHNELVHLIAQWQDTLIAIGYGFIALQFFRRARTNSKAGRAFYLLVLIFALCAVNGYVMHILPGQEWLQIIRVATMVPLVLATWWYVYRGMVVDVADALDRDAEHYQEIIDKAKRKID